MKGWIKKGLITLVALAAFPLALYAVLAMQGRLTSPDIETLRHVPLVGGLLPAAQEPEPSVAHGTAGGIQPREGHLTPRSDEWKRAVQIDEPEILVEELKARRRLYDEKLGEIQAERKVLDRLRAELDDREDILARFQDRIEMEKADLARQKRTIDERGRQIDAGTEKALKGTAKMIAEMDSQKAAEALTGLDEDRAADLLFAMDDSAAAAILDEIADADQRKSLIEKISLRQTEPKGATGGR